MKRYTAKTRAAALAFDIEDILRKSFPNKMNKSKLNLFEEEPVGSGADNKADVTNKSSEENGCKKRLRRESRAPPMH